MSKLLEFKNWIKLNFYRLAEHLQIDVKLHKV